jgi:hypothetical protein
VPGPAHGLQLTGGPAALPRAAQALLFDAEGLTDGLLVDVGMPVIHRGTRACHTHMHATATRTRGAARGLGPAGKQPPTNRQPPQV